jgi:Peptidase_C39 like family
MNSIFRKSLLSVCGLMASGGILAGPASAAYATPAPATAGHAAKPAAADQSDQRQRGARFDYQAQPNFYYCGPASTRIALSAAGKPVSQDELAAKLGTTENGTDSAIDVTRVLNQYTGGRYKTTEIPADVATKEQIERLRADVKAALEQGRPVVANIRGTALDVDGVAHSYPGHYVTVVEYKNDGNTVLIADPASPNTPTYWMNVTDVANWIASRGYSS